MSGRTAIVIALALTSAACASRISPLVGVPTRRALPATRLPAGHRLVSFKWTLDMPDMLTQGEGAVRIAPPDSARLDFFLAGGMGSGAAVLIGDEVRLPPGTEIIVDRLMLPAPLLWGIIGRVALPGLPDTVMRVDGDTLRADVGNPVAWRLTFARDSLRRIEHISNQRVVEWVTRSADGTARYRHRTGRRQLDIVIMKTGTTAINAAAWTLP